MPEWWYNIHIQIARNGVPIMGTAKRTYALPNDVLERFEGAIAPGKRSAKIAELIDAYIQERNREALRESIAEGCREMWDIYIDTAKEWEPLDKEIDLVRD